MTKRLAVALLVLAVAIVLAGAPPASAQDPTPTPSPADAALAERFAAEGRYEAAIGAYEAVIAEGDDAGRLAARLALAAVLLDDGRPAEAVRQLDAYLFEAPAGADVRRAQLLLAEALAAAGEWEQALPLYDAYVDGRGVASVYARLGRAEALARAGRAPEAALGAEALLREELPDGVRLAFVLTMAQSFEASDSALAVAWYERLRDESAAPADQALALWRLALLRRDLGDQAWVGDLVRLIEEYPESPLALEALERAPDLGLGLDIDGSLPARVYYHNGEDDLARALFEDILDLDAGSDTALAAEATYRLAVIDEREGLTSSAIARYGEVFEIDPSSPFADDGLWWQAQLLEAAGRDDDALLSYHTIEKSFPASEWAPDARFRVALILYDGKDYDDAAAAFAAIAANRGDEERSRALLWQGKALAATGDDDGAEAAWRFARDETPDEYYGLRAAVLLGEAGGSLRDAGIDEEEPPDWEAIEAWLDARSEDAPAARAELAADPHWLRGLALLALGLRTQAGAEVGLVLEDAGRDEAKLYEVARASTLQGLPEFAARAATRLLTAAGADAGSAPPDLRRLAYPAPFAALVREAADEQDVPDVLLLALVRQESFFDPLAGSSAGALGLTQVIPPTGEEIAAELELDSFAVEQLFRPQLNLRFGAYYLGQQLEDADLYQALAAYNGGPGSAERWRREAGDDVDRFVAAIDFGQTSLYVRLVSENLAHYRQLYGGRDRPELPAD